MSDLIVGIVAVSCCVIQLLCGTWQTRARKRLEHVAQIQCGEERWLAAQAELKMLGYVFLALFLGFYVPAFYWRMQDATREESYVFMGMVFGLIVANSGWQSWIYWKLVRSLDAKYRRMAIKMAVASAAFNLALVGFIYIVFTKMKG